jgi:hypothetical protein
MMSANLYIIVGFRWNNLFLLFVLEVVCQHGYFFDLYSHVEINLIIKNSQYWSPPGMYLYSGPMLNALFAEHFFSAIGYAGAYISWRTKSHPHFKFLTKFQIHFQGGKTELENLYQCVNSCKRMLSILYIFVLQQQQLFTVLKADTVAATAYQQFCTGHQPSCQAHYASCSLGPSSAPCPVGC